MAQSRIHSLIVLVLLASGLVDGLQAETRALKPNIVFILCDDLGYADVGFNAELFGVETDVVTPQIDALAKGGTIFKQAYVPHPFCGPSRMGMMSGRMPHCFGGQKNLPDVSRNLEDYNQRGIPVEETLISTALKEAGYATGCIGKWHLGASQPFHPNTRGFDEFFGFLGGGHQYYPSISDKVEPKLNDYQYFLERNGEKHLSPEGAYLTDMLSEEAVDFIGKKKSGGDNPFFLYLAYNAPHSPLQGKTEDLQKLYPDHKPSDPKNGINFRDYEARQNYVAMVYAVDRGIGLIVEALKKESILDQTLIVFLSDNGGKIAQGGINTPLQDDKGSALEGGIRVPMFMHWPNQLAAGRVYDHSVLALDLYPTFAALAGAETPKGKILDGKNVWSHLHDNTPAHSTDVTFWLRHHGGGNEIAIRQGDFKAYRKNFGKWQLFDLSADLGEKIDLSKKHTERLDSMIKAGRTWSDSHLVPQWHDTKASLETWEKNKMPKYSETFQRR